MNLKDLSWRSGNGILFSKTDGSLVFLPGAYSSDAHSQLNKYRNQIVISNEFFSIDTNTDMCIIKGCIEPPKLNGRCERHWRN